MHEIQAELDADGWKNADAGVREPMGYGMCGLRRTPAAFKARQPNAAGTDSPSGLNWCHCEARRPNH